MTKLLSLLALISSLLGVPVSIYLAYNGIQASNWLVAILFLALAIHQYVALRFLHD